MMLDARGRGSNTGKWGEDPRVMGRQGSQQITHKNESRKGWRERNNRVTLGIKEINTKALS